jgi:ligand-binding sensor domain-containing protein
MKISKNLIWVVLLIFFTSYDCEAQELNSNILFSKEKKYVVQGNTLSEFDKKGKFNTLLEFKDNVFKVIINQNELWMATDKGIQIYDLNNLKYVRTEFLNDKIADLTVDIEGKIWVATFFKGVYRQTDDHGFEKKLNVTTNYCITSTSNGNVYIGTNLGMYEFSIKTSNIIRYAEEAHSGHGLPDNIVEALYADEYSNIWVIMPDNIAFKKSDNYLGEIPTFSYVGNKENKIYKILGIQKQSYLFITQQGILLLPSSSLKEHSHNDEIFSGHDTNAFKLSNKFLNAPENLSQETVLYAEKNGKYLYFYTLNGVWRITEKQLINKLDKKA